MNDKSFRGASRNNATVHAVSIARLGRVNPRVTNYKHHDIEEGRTASMAKYLDTVTVSWITDCNSLQRQPQRL